MKSNLNLLVIVFLLLGGACQQKVNEPSVSDTKEIDVEMETTAIMAVIEGESTAFWEKDLEKWESYWVHAPYIRTMGWWKDGGVTVVEGWEQRFERSRKNFEISPEANATATNVRRENINIRIYQDVAWMTFDQYGEDTGDSLLDMPGLSRETRIMEKIDGTWKIAYVGWLLEGE